MIFDENLFVLVLILDISAPTPKARQNWRAKQTLDVGAGGARDAVGGSSCHERPPPLSIS